MFGLPVTAWCVVRPGAAVAGVLVLGLLAGCSSGGGGGASAPAPTATAMRPPTATGTPVATRTATAIATATATSPAAPPTATATGTTALTATVTPTAVATATATETPTVTPTLTRSPTPTATPLTGPIITAFGVADGSGTVNESHAQDAENRPVFRTAAGDGFILFVEGRPGVSRLPVGTLRLNTDTSGAAQPDLQLVSSNDLGQATTAVCDGDFPVRGGVPAVVPPRFDPVPAVSNALNDLACRFKVFGETDFACTQNARGNFVFADAGTVLQFCTLVNEALTFPAGDTVLSARLRDAEGNAGPTAEIVVRVGGGQ